MEPDEIGTREHFIIKLEKITNVELHISCYRLSDDLKGKITCPVVFLEQALLSGCVYIFTYIDGQ